MMWKSFLVERNFNRKKHSFSLRILFLKSFLFGQPWQS